MHKIKTRIAGDVLEDVVLKIPQSSMLVSRSDQWRTTVTQLSLPRPCPATRSPGWRGGPLLTLGRDWGTMGFDLFFGMDSSVFLVSFSISLVFPQPQFSQWSVGSARGGQPV